MLSFCRSNLSIGIGSLMGRRGRMIGAFEGVWVVMMRMEEGNFLYMTNARLTDKLCGLRED